MQIQQLTVTPEEVAEAVQEYLVSRFNIKVKVKEVAKKYFHDSDYTVSLEVIENVKAPESVPPPSVPMANLILNTVNEHSPKDVPTEEEVKELNSAP